MLSLTVRAALRLTSRPPQNTFGQVSDTIEMSTPPLSMALMRMS